MITIGGKLRIKKERIDCYFSEEETVKIVVNGETVYLRCISEEYAASILETLDNTFNLKLSENKETTITSHLKKKAFEKPTLAEVAFYFQEKGCQDAKLESEKFYDFYESKDWHVGKNKMRDWMASVRNWIRVSQNRSSGGGFNKGRDLLESWESMEGL